MASIRSFVIGRVLPLLGLAACVYGITSIPYALAVSRTPAGAEFGGFLAFDQDQDMYFSFIRQGADGHILFINRLTSFEHDPVFLNLEWLAVGWVLALCGSPDLAYQVWRAAGAGTVVFGFWTLARVTLTSTLQRRIALAMALFGGGFHWLFYLANEISRLVSPTAEPWSLDFLYFAMHPYGQILANPHFALPLGLLLFCFAAFMRGEQTRDWHWYATAGAVGALDGLMRPYDMIALFTTLPLFVVFEALVDRRVDLRAAWLRFTPLLVMAPVFLYTVFLFSAHPIFKFWASQGSVARFGITDTLVHAGLAVPLVVLRLALVRRFPLASAERLLLSLLATVFILVHGTDVPLFRFMPYAPQLMTILMPPAILLGVAALAPGKDGDERPARSVSGSGTRIGVRRRRVAVFLTAFVAFNSIDSVTLLERIAPQGGRDMMHFIPQSEKEAYDWLARHASENDVVLCVQQTGHRLAKYASVRVALGHWSVTPGSKEIAESVQAFYDGRMHPAERAGFVKQLDATWIYFGANEREWGMRDLDGLPGFRKEVINRNVAVYRRADRHESSP